MRNQLLCFINKNKIKQFMIDDIEKRQRRKKFNSTYIFNEDK